MQKKNQVKKHITLSALIVLTAITILFFAYEKLLANGWYYIPDRAIAIASILCILWQSILLVGAYLLSKHLKMILHSWTRYIAITLLIFAAIVLFLFLALNLILYSIKFEEKMEQYDEHIALYVKNTFVRTEHRYPHYMYEENWLFMRKLRDDELNEAIQKYGDPDNYYN